MANPNKYQGMLIEKTYYYFSFPIKNLTEPSSITLNNELIFRKNVTSVCKKEVHRTEYTGLRQVTKKILKKKER